MLKRLLPLGFATSLTIAGKITGLYTLIGGAWILLSDFAVMWIASDPATVASLQTAKGWIYVVATALLLFMLIRSYVGWLQRSEDELRQVLATTPGILKVSTYPDLETRFMSDAAQDLLGCQAARFVEYPGLWRNRLPLEERERALTSIRDQLEDFGSFTVEYPMLLEDGSTLRRFREHGRFDDTRSGAAERLVASAMTDITEQESWKEKYYELNHRDPLTGLMNARTLTLVLNNLIGVERDRLRPLAGIVFGIDRLNHINAVHGRTGGDRLVTDVAQKLTKLLRSHVTNHVQPLAARIGGGRFMAVFPDVRLEQARAIAGCMLEELATLRVTFEGRSLASTFRAGVVAFPEHVRDAETFVALGEHALENARRLPASGSISLAGEETQRQGADELNQLQRIMEALEQDRLALHFQPIVEIATGRIDHYEALLRMQEVDGVLVTPVQVIGVAERFGIIHQIDARVVDIALGYLEAMRMTAPEVTIAVNLSGASLGHPEFIEALRQRLAAPGARPERLIFEITETAAVGDLTVAREFMEHSRAQGVRFALDDFGIGFTSFGQLQALPVDIIKIDGSFVRNCHRDATSLGLVEAITKAAKSYRKKVVAEFVENPIILELLARREVDFAQGYHIGRPVPMGAEKLRAVSGALGSDPANPLKMQGFR